MGEEVGHRWLHSDGTALVGYFISTVAHPNSPRSPSAKSCTATLPTAWRSSRCRTYFPRLRTRFGSLPQETSLIFLEDQNAHHVDLVAHARLEATPEDQEAIPAAATGHADVRVYRGATGPRRNLRLAGTAPSSAPPSSRRQKWLVRGTTAHPAKRVCVRI